MNAWELAAYHRARRAYNVARFFEGAYTARLDLRP